MGEHWDERILGGCYNGYIPYTLEVEPPLKELAIPNNHCFTQDFTLQNQIHRIRQQFLPHI